MSAPTLRAEKAPKKDHPILFQKYFKSLGPRTYAIQVKQASNGNHYLVLTEGKRDAKTEEVRKTKLFVFSEDFKAFFDLVHAAAEFDRAHPTPDDVQKKQAAFWAGGAKPQRRRGNFQPRKDNWRRPDDRPGPAPSAKPFQGRRFEPARADNSGRRTAPPPDRRRVAPAGQRRLKQGEFSANR